MNYVTTSVPSTSFVNPDSLDSWTGWENVKELWQKLTRCYFEDNIDAESDKEELPELGKDLDGFLNTFAVEDGE